LQHQEKNPLGVVVTATDHAEAIAQFAADAAIEKGAENVMLIDVSDRIAITDMFIVASASNDRQVRAIADAIEERLLKERVKPLRREGQTESRWILLDFGDLVAHVQMNEERAFYALERLWKDCPTRIVTPPVPAAKEAAPAQDTL
jgi:ribosome-associated protein